MIVLHHRQSQSKEPRPRPPTASDLACDALLRTLGFGRWRIAYLLFGEAMILGLIGGAMGAVVALALFVNGTDLGSLTNGLALSSAVRTSASSRSSDT